MRNGVVKHGWTIAFHPLFIEQLNSLEREVIKVQKSSPDTLTQARCFKQFAAIKELIYNRIPEDPTRTIYRQGSTLGSTNKNWFRAKFGGQHRLFFRFDQASKVIVFAWFNDESTLRAYGSKKDAYKVFKGMLKDGNPPSTWQELLESCNT